MKTLIALLLLSVPLSAQVYNPASSSATVVAHIAAATYSATSASGFVTFYTTTAAGQYRACASLSMVTPGTGSGNWQDYLKITTDGTITTPTLGLTILNAAIAGSLNTGGGSGNCSTYYLDTGVVVQWSLTPTGTITTAPTLRYSYTLEYLGS